ncbi:MAG TPA: archease [Solirubrobacteraceae bacterium]|nr:archease [Solirubrobacteraceae bacterium]
MSSHPSAPLIFPLPDHHRLLPAGLGEHSTPALGAVQLERFSNGELYARMGSRVDGRVCAVLGSLAPPDERLLSVLLLAHTLKREGARRVLALLPYLGYARQDRADPGQSLGIAWVGDLLRAAGVDEVITIDVHSHAAATCLGVPLQSLSPAPLFADVLARDGLEQLSVVAPDEGARERCQAVIRAAGIDAPLAQLRKRRSREGVVHSELVGEVSPKVAIVDDILDTGSTLVSACATLRRAGAREITVCATHGLFTGERWRELAPLGVRRIYTTDSVPTAGTHDQDIIQVLSSWQLLSDGLTSAAAETIGAGYRWLEHTSELELQIDAASEAAVFEQALKAFGELVSEQDADQSARVDDGHDARGPLTRELTVEAHDRGALLAAFLEELVYLLETEGLLPERLERLTLEGERLSATLRARRGRPRHLVKGVTYNDLAFAPAGEGFTATVVLDV